MLNTVGPAAVLIAAFLATPAPGAAFPPVADRCPAPSTAAGGAASPRPLTVKFLGTTSLLFDDGDTQILIDGYFSRPGLLRAFLGRVSPDQARIDYAVKHAGIGPRLKAIFVAHSHIDHVLDAPTIALATGADVIGSPFVAQVAIGHHLPLSRIRNAGHEVACGYGEFRVTPYETRHSKPNLVSGSINNPVPTVASALRYEADRNHAFLVEHGGRGYLVYPSAAYEPGALAKVKAEVVFLGIGGLGRKSRRFANGYWTEVVMAVGASKVYPIHWDNFGRPLAKGLSDMPRILDNVARGRRHLALLGRQFRVEIVPLELFKPVELASESAGPPPGR